ncbi:MAG: extracellular solute-binding protein family 1 [Solirubrobacterales bacterium]|jgi:iron(III) transport system substrate-binding protein|nr:extracellular solute-binding protein family 1 [Solirubrobacterales bacterium]
MPRPFLLALLLAAAVLGLSACGGDDAEAGSDGTLTVYSGRNEKLVGPLFERFEKVSGVKLEVRYGDSAELAATLAEEGDNSPAELFFSQDAGALGAVADAGLLTPLAAATRGKVDERWVDPEGRWVGISGRSRVVAYSTERVEEDELPDSIFEFTKPEWKGRIGFPPPNASFQAFVSAMRLEAGEERTKAWLEGIKANDPTLLENNIQTEEAIAAGEIDVGFVNHYYLAELKLEKPRFPVANHFMAKGDPGALVNVAGVGILEHEDTADAQKLVDFLLGTEAQEFFAQKTFEYPLVTGVAPPADLPALADLQGPEIELGKLGDELRGTLELLDEVGFGT